jgi:hypothetical protein
MSKTKKLILFKNPIYLPNYGLRIVQIEAKNITDNRRLARLLVDALYEEQLEGVSCDAALHIDQVELFDGWPSRHEIPGRVFCRQDIEDTNLENMKVPEPTPEEQAHHEAGHAVIWSLCGFDVESLRFLNEPEATRRGRWAETTVSGELPRIDLIEGDLAGPIAEAYWRGEDLRPNDQRLDTDPDFERFVKHSSKNWDVRRAEFQYRVAYVKHEYIIPNWATIQKVANALLKKRVLSGDDFERIVGEGSGATPGDRH